jgi:hypothetical protein
MSTLSQFMGSGAPVGSLIQAPFNVVDASYLACDGRALTRIDYPVLASCLPNVGVFSRSTAGEVQLPVTPNTCTAVNNGTLWAIPAGAGTNNILTSPDGSSWTFRTTPASTNTKVMLQIGTRMLAIGPNASTGRCLYSTNGTTWTASGTNMSDVDASNTVTSAAYSPSIGANGRVIVCSGE